jgi:hypothetical protein
MLLNQERFVNVDSTPPNLTKFNRWSGDSSTVRTTTPMELSFYLRKFADDNVVAM